MTTETWAVPDVHCDHCVNSIEGVLKGLGGVAGATVDLGQKTVTVTYDAGGVDRNGLIQAIEGQGYEVLGGTDTEGGARA